MTVIDIKHYPKQWNTEKKNNKYFWEQIVQVSSQKIIYSSFIYDIMC